MLLVPTLLLETEQTPTRFTDPPTPLGPFSPLLTGPHTISVPRMRPADGSELSITPPHSVDDENFKKLVAIIRIAVPYTGMILSTRESPEMRAELLKVGEGGGQALEGLMMLG